MGHPRRRGQDAEVVRFAQDDRVFCFVAICVCSPRFDRLGRARAPALHKLTVESDADPGRVVARKVEGSVFSVVLSTDAKKTLGHNCARAGVAWIGVVRIGVAHLGLLKRRAGNEIHES